MKPTRAESDIAGIRATLRLLFSEEAARRLAALSGCDKPEDRLSRLVGRASLRLRFDRWRKRLQRRQATNSGPPLGSTSRLSPRQSLALALHLGLNLPATELADLLQQTAEEIGEELYQARAALSPQRVAACPGFTPALGRYRDHSLEINQRITLLRHTAECAECQKTLEEFQRIDEGLRQHVDDARSSTSTALPKPLVQDRLLTSPKLWLTAGAVLALVIVLLAGIGVSRLFGSNQTPVPLLASAQSAGTAPAGWLLTVDPSTGALQAIDLTNGRSRGISSGNGSPGSSYAQAVLSPDQTLVASWNIMYDSDPSGPANRVSLMISRLDGSGVFQRVWPLPDPPLLAGWLDNTHVLMTSTEPVGDPGSNRYTTALISLDVTNGDTHTLLSITGGSAIDDVSASPDGALVAISYSKANESYVELRAVRGNHLGPPAATIHDVASNALQSALVWSPDSRHLYLSRIDDPGAPVLTNTGVGIHWSHRSIIAVDRSGKVTTTISPPGKLQAAIPIILMPGSQRLVYEVEDLTKLRSGVITSSIWERSLVPGPKPAPKLLLKNVMPATAIAFANPAVSDQILLEVVEPSYLENATENRSLSNGINWPVIYAVDANGTTTPVETSPSLTASALVGWIPEAALPATATGDSSTTLNLSQTTHESVPDLDGVINGASIVSPNGNTVVTTNPRVGRGGLMRLDRVSGDSQSWSQDIRDPAWFGQAGDILLAATVPSQYLPSRLEWLAATGSRVGQSYDGLAVDPANISNSRSVAYADPAVSANGLATAFFVVDTNSHRAALWIASLHHPPRQVDQWSYGGKQLGDLPLIAAWINDTTLLYAVPGDWRSGLPQSPSLVRLTLQPDGSTNQQMLVTFHRTGSDRGLAIAGLTLSPDRATLAVRLRHYSHNDAHSGVTDAIRLMPAGDLHQQIEVDRAASGAGLSWSPDGRWLAFGLKHDVGVVAANGKAMRYVDASGSAGAPLWVNNEIWFTAARAGKPTNERIIFH